MIQCDGVWGREAVTVVIVFLFHGIHIPHTHHWESCRKLEKI